MSTITYVVHPGTDTFFAADEAYIAVAPEAAELVDVAPNTPTIAQLLEEQKAMIQLIERIAALVELSGDDEALADAGWYIALDAHDLLHA